MSRPSKGKLSAWLRAGQTIGHTFDMIREVLARIVIVLILWGVVCVVCVNLRATDDEQSYGSREGQRTQSHIVIRVNGGGVSLRVFLLYDATEDMRGKAVSGRFQSR